MVRDSNWVADDGLPHHGVIFAEKALERESRHLEHRPCAAVEKRRRGLLATSQFVGEWDDLTRASLRDQPERTIEGLSRRTPLCLCAPIGCRNEVTTT